MIYKCCVANCGVSSKLDPSVSFHVLPKKSELRAQWLKCAKIKESACKKPLVCSRHFTPPHFQSILKAELLGTKSLRILILGGQSHRVI